jgi:hypothetical protein
MIKKLMTLLLSFVLAFAIFACRNNSEIPSLDDVKTQYFTDDELEITLRRVERDDLIAAWGTPDRHVQRENEDVWILGEGRVIVVSYNFNDRVKEVDIED